MLAAAAPNKPLRVIYVPMSGDQGEHFEHVGRLVLAAGNIVFYVDEIDTQCSPSSLMPKRSAFWSRPENQYRTSALEEILNRGRHKGVAGVFMSRFPTQVNTTVRSQAQEMRVFRSDDPNYVKWFRDKDARIAVLLGQLHDYEYVLAQDGRTPVIAGGRRNL